MCIWLRHLSGHYSKIWHGATCLNVIRCTDSKRLTSHRSCGWLFRRLRGSYRWHRRSKCNPRLGHTCRSHWPGIRSVNSDSRRCTLGLVERSSGRHCHGNTSSEEHIRWTPDPWSGNRSHQPLKRSNNNQNYAYRGLDIWTVSAPNDSIKYASRKPSPLKTVTLIGWNLNRKQGKIGTNQDGYIIR